MQLPLKRKFLCSSEVPPRVKAFYSLFCKYKIRYCDLQWHEYFKCTGSEYKYFNRHTVTT